MNNIGLFNITHTDSYLQNISNRFNSLYSQLGAKLIFPLVIWKNNTKDTLLSTGNISKILNIGLSENMSNYKINMINNNVRQNIPKQNYILAFEPVKIFNKVCSEFGMECMYISKWLELNNELEFKNSIESMIETVQHKYKTKINPIFSKDFSLDKQQVQFFRQYGINDYMKYNYSKNNKRNRNQFEQNDFNYRVNTNTNTKTNTNIDEIGIGREINQNSILIDENIFLNEDF